MTIKLTCGTTLGPRITYLSDRDRMQAELEGLDVVRCSAARWTGPEMHIDNMIRKAIDG